MSQGITDVLKHGWHPEKEGTTFKQQVTGVFKKDSSASRHVSHVSRPVSELKDPSTFGPPPRHVALGSGAATASPPPPPPPGSYRPQPASPTSQATSAPAPAAPESRPYRVDTTGLSTSHLPPPPVRRDGADTTHSAAPKPAPPSLPPRLPPRSSPAAAPTAAASSPQPPAPTRRADYLNQNAINRLGESGISVPGLGIGGRAPPSPSSAPPANTTTQVNSLQNRFSKFAVSPSGSPSGAAAAAATPPPAQGTTLAQKQAALQTAASFRKDPSSVSFADARAAASTANNFRQRHGDQVAAGWNSANNLNQKYGVSDKLGGFAGGSAGSRREGETSSPVASAAALLGKKKPAPPPPPKKPACLGSTAPGHEDGPPPPVPTASRPQF